MDERRDNRPEPEGGPPISGSGTLSPVQEAHAGYSSHANTCPKCRDIDRGRCAEGERLWRTWSDACDDAYEQLHGKSI